MGVGKLRISSRPEKTLLWMWLKRDMEKIGGEVGIDLAGGKMHNYGLFKTQKYICIDADRQRIERNKRIAGIECINCRIQDLEGIYGDVILCVQTYGINKYFEDEDTFLCIDKMVEMCRRGGTVVFNVGGRSYVPQQVEEYLVKRYWKSFNSIKVSRYGAFKGKYPKFMSSVIAWLMNSLPCTRTFFGLKERCVYCVMNSKKDEWQKGTM